MSRPVWLRALIGLWGLCFAATLAGAPGFHACALHGDHAMGAMRFGDTGPRATHSSSEHRENPPAHDSRHQSNECTCLGLCCCAAPVAAPAAAIAISGEAERIAAPVEVAEAGAPRTRRFHAQPFANGPPAA